MVSFEYDPAGGSDSRIDTGEALAEAPEMAVTDTADDALAPAILAQPGQFGEKKGLRVDVRALEAEGDYARLDYSFALADPADAPAQTLSIGTSQVWSHLHFGVNVYGDAGFPSGYRVTFIDEATGQQGLPVTAELEGRLCTEGADTQCAGYGGTSPLFSYFPAELLERETLTLRVADSGTWELDVASLTSGSSVDQN